MTMNCTKPLHIEPTNIEDFPEGPRDGPSTSLGKCSYRDDNGIIVPVSIRCIIMMAAFRHEIRKAYNL